MIDDKDTSQTLTSIAKNTSALNTLIEIEGVLDNLHMYAYANWEIGEIINGPIISKYWVTVELMYPANKMPDPNGSLRLTRHGCEVFFREDEYIYNKHLSTPDDLETAPDDPTSQRRKPKKMKSHVWVVTVRIPRDKIDEFNSKNIEINGVELNIDDVYDAEETDSEDNADAMQDVQTDESTVRSSMPLNEGLYHGEMDGMVSDTISIDQYKPKIGREEEIVVVAFKTKQERSATDLTDYIQSGFIQHMDVEMAPVPDTDGMHVVFVEFERDGKLFSKISSLLDDISNVAGDLKWKYTAYKLDSPRPFDKERFARDVACSKEEYLNKYNLNEAENIKKRMRFLVNY
jgi:hypothetical protein